MPKWLLEVRGFGLDFFERFLPEGYSIDRRGERRYLVVKETRPDRLASAEAEAHRILGLTNAFARLQVGDDILVERGGMVLLQDDGRMEVVLSATAHAGGSGRIILLSGEPPEDRGWLQRAEKHEGVLDALEYWRLPQQDWFTLWKIYELIRKSVGEAGIDAWMGRRERNRFQQTANHHRHAVGVVRLPKEPMNEDEAYRFVLQLLRKWLDHKLGGLA
jgi:hypothetical protein